LTALPTTIQVASIGIPDTLFLMLLALVVFGPRRLPEIGRQIGKLMYEFRKVSNDFKYQMEEELRASEEADRQKKLQAAASQVTLDVPPQPAPASLPEPIAETSSSGTVADFTPPIEESPSASNSTESADTATTTSEEPRSEPRKFPSIQPPSTGDPVAAQRPFRGRVAETETVTESGDAANHTVETPVAVIDEGRIGTEAQPGVVVEPASVTKNGSGQEAHHA